MTINDICTWNTVPDDLMMESMWFINILDGADNSIKFNDNNSLDVYVKSVNVPLNSIGFEKTNFGRLNVKERNFPSSVSISFFDSTNNPWLGKFQSWLDSIYDFEENKLKNKWRNQSKTLIVTQIKIEKKQSKYSWIPNPISGIKSIANAFKDVDLSQVEVYKIAEFELEGTYITKIEDLDFSSEGSGAKEFSIELECEKIKSNYKKQIIE